MGIFERPKLKGSGKKADMPDNLWTQCPSCSKMLHTLDLRDNFQVCANCDHHFLFGSYERIDSLADKGTFIETNAGLFSKNPLKFAKYEEKIALLREKTKLNDGVVSGKIEIHGNPAYIAVMDFKFFAGSMGSVAGEKITRAAEDALRDKCGLIIISASSGARMQEGMLSLMQMAKTCGAIARLGQAGLPYLSVMTHPTTGGVTASFATVGDVNLAEPSCMIGFAGPRVVKETTHQDLPKGFQTAEFMLTHGLLDGIVHRKDLRKKLGQLLTYMLPIS